MTDVLLPQSTRRIVVFGHSGSGKTTVGRTIADRLGLARIELDALFHKPNWEPSTDEEFHAKVARALEDATQGWVVDGNYSRVHDLTLGQAETAIWLRLPFRVVYPRLIWRTVSRAWTKESLWGTNRESWRLSFMSRDSILLWGITNWRPHVRKMHHTLAETPHNARVIEMRSTREVDALLRSLPAQRDTVH
ncbi:MAG: shikimate kinase [Dehalococcoidia bacterium]